MKSVCVIYSPKNSSKQTLSSMRVFDARDIQHTQLKVEIAPVLFGCNFEGSFLLKFDRFFEGGR